MAVVGNKMRPARKIGEHAPDAPDDSPATEISNQPRGKYLYTLGLDIFPERPQWSVNLS